MSSEKRNLSTKEIDTLALPLHPSDQWIPIGIGNYYKGQWNHRTMSGNGVYVMPDETVYKGNFDDGLFNGDGTIYYTSGSRIEGVWEKGKCVKRNYIFSDGLRFQQNNWRYCQTADRRFSIEHINGLEPAAKSHIKNQQSTIEIPEGLYDTGDGFYQPLTNTVHNYWTNELIRIPTSKGSKWIMENCRRGGKRVIGFSPNFVETKKNISPENMNVSPSKQTVNNSQLIMADIKSIPSSVYDLSLQNIRSMRGTYSLDDYDRLSFSSTSSSPSSSSVTDCEPNRCRKTVLIAPSERPSFAETPQTDIDA